MVLEAERVGHGASGRAGGFLLPFPAIPAWLLHGSLPAEERHEALATLSAELRQVAEHCIRLGAPVRPAQVVIETSSRLLARTFAWLAGTAREHGFGAEVWSGPEVAERCGGHGHAGFAIDAYRIQPYALAHHLADHVEFLDGLVVEDCAVLEIVPGADAVQLRTTRGDLRAGAAVLCTNAYSSALSTHGPSPRHIMHSYMCATGELPDAVLRALGEDVLVGSIGWGGLIYRRIDDRRLIFGALDLPGLPPNETSAADARARRRLRAVLARTLPSLADVAIEVEWGGPFVRNEREIPTLTTDPRSPRIVLNTGYGGGGIALSLYSGKLVRGLLDPHLDDPESARMRQAFARTRVRLPGLLQTGLEALFG